MIGNEPDKYCKYNRAKGHHEDGCDQQKEEMKQLIHEEHLRRYIKAITYNYGARVQPSRCNRPRSPKPKRDKNHKKEVNDNLVVTPLTLYIEDLLERH